NIILILILIFNLFCTACDRNQVNYKNLNYINNSKIIHLDYAEQFSVQYLENGCAEISITDGCEYILVPEDTEIPAHNPDQVILQQPLEHIYLAASSAMDLFDSLDSLDRIALTSTKDWSLPNVQNALDSGNILYAGKYSTPDYELLLSQECDIAIESTMIHHSPEVKEQIEQLGIPVFTERSSYETHPLGRMEWIKLYGLLLNQSEEAAAFFEQKKALFQEITNAVSESDPDQKQKTVAFFSISPNGYVTIRKPGDYVSHMIASAGGISVFTAENLEMEENSLSTMNIQLEIFYELAKDADIFIYNNLINDELDTLEKFLDKNPVLADCKAVQNGNVWCVGQNLFQQSTNAAEIIADFYAILHEDSDREIEFLQQLT
ncbi:MAG: ABC transporter substrate-binding protein, partial [Oscillospiraceae bacterium]|nr:ABC transporter substrate-binding protein [Oscillospiraceae bacterium]